MIRDGLAWLRISSTHLLRLTRLGLPYSKLVWVNAVMWLDRWFLWATRVSGRPQYSQKSGTIHDLAKLLSVDAS